MSASSFFPSHFGNDARGLSIPHAGESTPRPYSRRRRTVSRLIELRRQPLRQSLQPQTHCAELQLARLTDKRFPLAAPIPSICSLKTSKTTTAASIFFSTHRSNFGGAAPHTYIATTPPIASFPRRSAISHQNARPHTRTNLSERPKPPICTRVA